MDKQICCCHKSKDRSEEEYKSLIHRLNRIEGQIRGIRGMVEKGAYCTDILIQSAAVTAAVNAFNKELLANHIRTCVAQDIRDGKDEIDLVAVNEAERAIVIGEVKRNPDKIDLNLLKEKAAKILEHHKGWSISFAGLSLKDM